MRGTKCGPGRHYLGDRGAPSSGSSGLASHGLSEGGFEGETVGPSQRPDRPLMFSGNRWPAGGSCATREPESRVQRIPIFVLLTPLVFGCDRPPPKHVISRHSRATVCRTKRPGSSSVRALSTARGCQRGPAAPNIGPALVFVKKPSWSTGRRDSPLHTASAAQEPRSWAGEARARGRHSRGPPLEVGTPLRPGIAGV